MGTAKNIKDKPTRKGVLSALGHIDKCTRKYRGDLSRGAFVFGAPDGAWILEPDAPLSRNFYRCGKTWDVEHYIELCGDHPKIGVVDLHLKEAKIYLEIAESRQLKHVITSGIPGAHNQGGQSQQRFLRAHSSAVKTFLGRVMKEMRELKVDRWEYTGNRLLTRIIMVQ